MATVNKAKFATALAIEVNKKGADGKYNKLGEVKIFVPLLADAGIEAEQAKDAAGILMVEDGLPVYVDDYYNWIQGAMLAQTKAQARNKLVSGTATLKDGKVIADDWETITAEAEGVGNPAALLAVREIKAAFQKWVASLGKSAAAQGLLTTLFNSKQSLTVQSTENKAKMEGYVNDFADSLDADALTKGLRYITGVLDACKPIEDATDF